MINWESYQTSFREEAKRRKLPHDFIENCLKYAQNLNQKNLPIIFDSKHLSMLVGVTENYLSGIYYATEKFYRTFEISKKNGDSRKISEPLPLLKDIQKWVLEEILSKEKISKFAKAYKRKVSIRDNAKFHTNQKIVLNLDIQDFFPSFKFKKILNYFLAIGYTKKVSLLLSRICTLQGTLPQGAPTSSALSNILFKSIDSKISKFCIRNKIKFTRYSDDLTFSGDFDYKELINVIRNTLQPEGFFLNPKKTRALLQHQKQHVTGLIVNRKINTDKEYRRKVRQEVYYLKKYGLDNHLYKTGNNRSNYLFHLLGKINHILFINPHDAEAQNARAFIQGLIKESYYG